ncbi:hypothetical protein AB1H94_03050 [Pseudomonas fulva]
MQGLQRLLILSFSGKLLAMK